MTKKTVPIEDVEEVPASDRKAPDLDAVRSAVVLTAVDGDSSPLIGDPAPGGKYSVKRSSAPRVIPIQFILKSLRAAYPESTFIFNS